MPTISDILVGRSTSDTFKNKTVGIGGVSFINFGSGYIPVQLNLYEETIIQSFNWQNLYSDSLSINMDYKRLKEMV